MLSSHSDTRPLWFDTATIPKFHQQTGQVVVDVCIIGGGITGVTAADLLKRAGKTVAIVDVNRIGCGETGHTTAHLTEVLDIDFQTLIANFGEEGARTAIKAARHAINTIEANSKERGIDCGFQRVPGFRFSESEDGVDGLEEESQAALKLGVQNELLYETPLPFEVARAIRFDNQAQFQPLEYLASLAKGIEGDGSFIFEETRMLDIHEGEPCRVTTDRGIIIADDVIVAANVPVSNRFFLQTKIASYRTYAIALKVADHFNASALFWDTLDPYHYIRSFEFAGSRYLIIGGEDHKTGKDEHTAVHFQKLEDWAHERFTVEKVTHRWSGQVIHSVDGLPFIGRNSLSDHVFVATGFSGTGMTFGTVAGILLSDLILGQQSPWADLFDAGRVKPWAAIKNYVRENFDYPSHMITDRFTPAKSTDTNLLRENEGAIVRIGSKKVAAYRDPQGELHLLSPVCPHMGCYVHWNDAERSWDCPCHGSRFTATGQLVNGPAIADLATETNDEEAPMIPERYEQPSPLNPFAGPTLSMFFCPLKDKPT
ncbi:MAG TPA: FAD-dependent oxidoreductase [Bdellovibrionales bacterium]|nr:FAD-dependent oxidoreductase [Bdellovibrionales bacterium]